MATGTKPVHSNKSQPIKWHGGKSYLAPWLHSLAPPSCIDDPSNGYTHRNIAFAGGLGEYWNWLPIEGVSETVNDANSELSNFWSVLAHDEWFEGFRRRVEATPLSETEWQRSAHTPRGDNWGSEVRRAVQFFIRYRMSRQGLGRDYATPTRRTRRGMNEQVSAWLSAVEGLPECHARLRRVEIRNMDCLAFVAKYDHPRALFYCDPPYMHETRSTTGEYAHEMSEAQHRALLAQLARIEGRFMLSGYRSELYANFAELEGWHCHTKDIDNKASSAKVKEKKTECVWTNYAADCMGGA